MFDKFVLFSVTWFARQFRCLGGLSSSEFLRLSGSMPRLNVKTMPWSICNFTLLASERYESLMPRRYGDSWKEVYLLGMDVDDFSEIELKDLPLFLGWSYRTSGFAKIFKDL